MRVVVLTALVFAAAMVPSQSEAPVPPGAVWNRPPLQQNAFALLPLGAITPTGWLRRQLEIQAAGLTGHLHDIWPDVGPDSAWLGGTGEGWERGPYFLDGLVPLAHLLGDPKLKAVAQRFVDWTLANQAPSGWIGPAKNTDWWPNMVMLKVLTQHHEATGDPRVIPVMQKYFAHHLAAGREKPLHQWAIYRWADELVSVIWLYNRTGDPKLLDLARLLHEQGADWQRHFATFEFTSKTSSDRLGLKAGMPVIPDAAMRAHGVNNAMALKTSALWSLISGDASDRTAILQALAALDRHHPMVNGMFTATEHYAGPDPSQGVELCAVLEALYSLQHVVAVNGLPAIADRIERIAYNAMPATFSADMWAHQYNQQANQVLCTLEKRHWVSNGPESNLFGVEPNFGCCTANMHQGWPKLVQSLWMLEGGASAAQGAEGPRAHGFHGLAAIVYAPSEVRAVVGDGVPVTVVEDTGYPFRGDVRFTVTPARAVRFPLSLRIPGWAAGRATVTLNGAAYSAREHGGFVRLDREWKAGDVVGLTLPMDVRTSTWHNGGVALERGPLVFSLRMGEDWRKVATGMKKPAPAPAADWEVRPTTPWNYALAVEPPHEQSPEVRRQRLAGTGPFRVVERPIGEFPFSPLGAPVEIAVDARKLPQWTLVEGSAGPLPISPVTSSEPLETVTLVPYGSAKLRVTVFPRLDR